MKAKTRFLPTKSAVILEFGRLHPGVLSIALGGEDGTAGAENSQHLITQMTSHIPSCREYNLKFLEARIDIIKGKGTSEAEATS